MDPNTMLEIAKTGAPILQSSLSGIVGAILGTLFYDGILLLQNLRN